MQDVNSWLPFSCKNKNSQAFLHSLRWQGECLSYHQELCESQESLRIFIFATRRKSRINVLQLYAIIINMIYFMLLILTFRKRFFVTLKSYFWYFIFESSTFLDSIIHIHDVRSLTGVSRLVVCALSLRVLNAADC